MSPPGEAQARRHRRAHARVVVEYHWGNRTGTGTTGDVSEGGMFVATDEVAPAGTRIYLRLRLPERLGGESVQLIGMVKRAVLSDEEGHQGMGIHFEVATTRAREQLRDFVRTLLVDHEEVTDQIGDSVRDSILPATGRRAVVMPKSEAGWQRATAWLFRLLLVLVLVGVLAYVLLIVIGKFGSKH